MLGQVNDHLPYMYGDAVQAAAAYHVILDDPACDFHMFSVPKAAVAPADHMIGLNVTSLIRDNLTEADFHLLLKQGVTLNPFEYADKSLLLADPRFEADLGNGLTRYILNRHQGSHLAQGVVCHGAFLDFPFGSDFTGEEIELSKALKCVKERVSTHPVRTVAGITGQFFSPVPPAVSVRTPTKIPP